MSNFLLYNYLISLTQLFINYNLETLQISKFSGKFQFYYFTVSSLEILLVCEINRLLSKLQGERWKKMETWPEQQKVSATFLTVSCLLEFSACIPK